MLSPHGQDSAEDKTCEMSRGNPKKLTLIGVHVEDEWLANLERWISECHPKMSRPEAIRRLVELGLRADMQAAVQLSEAESHAAKAAKLARELGLKAKK